MTGVALCLLVASYAPWAVAALLLPVLLSLPPVALGWWALPLPLISPESQDPPPGGRARITGSPDHSGTSVLAGVKVHRLHCESWGRSRDMDASVSGRTGPQAPLLLLPRCLRTLELLESCVASPAAAMSSRAVDSAAMARGPGLPTLLFLQFSFLDVFPSTLF